MIQRKSTLSKASKKENLSENDFIKQFIDSLWPHEKLKLDIARLEKIDLPAAKIASFLFKAQLVEIELRSLLESLDAFLEIKTKIFYIYRKVSKNELEVRKNSNLGQLKEELNNYQGVGLENLKTRLSLFHKERNKFTHALFLQNRDIEALATEAEKYRKHAEETLVLINKIDNDVWKKGI